MLIDIGFLLIVIFAIFKGYGKGFIVAVFSFGALFIGLAAALKLSSTVAVHLYSSTHLNGYWLPVISFVLVFALFVFVIRAAAVVVKKVASLVLLGPVDTLAGILLYALIYLMIYSVVLFYASNIFHISDETQNKSITYSFIKPMGPKIINWVGVVVPFFKNMFADLSHFFKSVSTQ